MLPNSFSFLRSLVDFAVVVSLRQTFHFPSTLGPLVMSVRNGMQYRYLLNAVLVLTAHCPCASQFLSQMMATLSVTGLLRESLPPFRLSFVPSKVPEKTNELPPVPLKQESGHASVNPLKSSHYRSRITLVPDLPLETSPCCLIQQHLALPGLLFPVV